jgi:hypothetical protein
MSSMDEGQSLSQPAQNVPERAAPSTRDWLKKIAQDVPVDGVSSEEIVGSIHQGRAERDDQLLRALLHR